MSSGASGMRVSKCWKIDATANTAFFRTYACRCSRHARVAERRGSMSSGSRSLHRNRNVLPRMYSLGCWRSFRIPLLGQFSKITFQLGAYILTRPESSPASTFQWHPVLDIFRSRNTATSLKT